MNPKILIIDSRDRISGSSTDFHLDFSPAILGAKKIELLTVNIPTTIFNIDASNNLIYFSEGGPLLTGTITPGNYDSNTILPAIKSAMEAVGALIYTPTYDQTTFRLTITGSAVYSLLFSNTTNSSADQLGYFNIDTGAALSHIADESMDLANPDYYIIEVRGINSHVKSSNSNDRGTFFISANFLTDGSIEIWQKNTNYNYCELQDDQIISHLDIRLLTYNKTLLDLQGSDWNMSWKIYYKNEEWPSGFFKNPGLDYGVNVEF